MKDYTVEDNFCPWSMFIGLSINFYTGRLKKSLKY